MSLHAQLIGVSGWGNWSCLGQLGVLGIVLVPASKVTIGRVHQKEDEIIGPHQAEIAGGPPYPEFVPG